MKQFFLLPLVAVALALTACNPDDNDNPTPAVSYASGVYVTAEGSFPNGAGALTYQSRDRAVYVRDLFQQANSRPLGNTTQSMAHWNNTGILVVNNANKLEFVNLSDFKSTGELVGFELPSRIAVLGNKAYVTEWVSFGGNGRVKVVDLASKSVLKSLTAGAFPDAITVHNGKVYVANSNGNSVLVIDPTTDTYEDTLAVGDYPNSFASDLNGNLWVLCAGVPSFAGTPTAASLWKLGQATAFFNLGIRSSTNDLCANKDKTKLYFSMEGALQEIDPTAAPTRPTAVLNRNFYAIGFDPVSGFFYGTDAVDFSSSGKLIRYNSSFIALDSVETGVAPGSIYFK